MKLKNIYKYALLACMVLYLSSCTNNTDAEQLFDATPTERLNDRMTELNAVLPTSEFGWKAVYFTDDTQLGGYTHLFKFSANGKVQMASDFDDDTSVYESDYSVVLGSTVSLLFDTFNRIHLLSDSDNSPTTALRGKGYLGDFQFLYYGQENGTLLFKSNRLVRDIRFVKATAQDWTDLSKNLLTEQKVIGEASRPLFRLLEINDGKTTKQYDFAFNKATRYAISNAIDPNSEEVVSFGVGYTPTGIVVSPAIEVGEQKITDFVYNDTDGSFTATGTAGVTASIKYSSEPLVLTDDYKPLLDESVAYQFSYYNNDTTADAPTNSAQFKTTINDINTFLADYGVSLEVVELYFNYPGIGDFIYYQFSDGSTFLHRINVTEDSVGKKIILTHRSGNVPFYIKTLDDLILDPQGIYVKKESFKLGYSNTIYTFTGSSSVFRMTTYKI